MSRAIELQHSRKGRADRDQSSEIEFAYKAHGFADESEALAAVSAACPADIIDPATGTAVLYRGPITWQQTGPEQWDITVTYVDPATQERQLETGEYRVTFSTGGGTTHITAAKETRNRYAPAGKNAPNHFGAIGVTEAGEVQGCDIVTPQLRFTITYKQPRAIITDAYVRTLEALTGTYNADTFKGRDAGEVLFMGSDGAQGTNADPEVSYNFARQPNVTGLAIGDITGISKKGWDYLWVEFETDADVAAKRLARKPRAVHVERVYDPGDFSLLGI